MVKVSSKGILHFHHSSPSVINSIVFFAKFLKICQLFVYNDVIIYLSRLCKVPGFFYYYYYFSHNILCDLNLFSPSCQTDNKKKREDQARGNNIVKPHSSTN